MKQRFLLLKHFVSLLPQNVMSFNQQLLNAIDLLTKRHNGLSLTTVSSTLSGKFFYSESVKVPEIMDKYQFAVSCR